MATGTAGAWIRGKSAPFKSRAHYARDTVDFGAEGVFRNSYEAVRFVRSRRAEIQVAHSASPVASIARSTQVYLLSSGMVAELCRIPDHSVS